MRAVLEEYGGMTGRELSEMSHEEPGWRYSQDGEDIPLATALIDPEPEVTEQMRETARSLAATDCLRPQGSRRSEPAGAATWAVGRDRRERSWSRP